MSEGPTFPSAEATHSVKKDGGFAKFVQNRAVQMAGVGLLGIFIGTGATATGVAVAGNGNGNGPDRSGFSQQWQAPGGNGMPPFQATEGPSRA